MPEMLPVVAAVPNYNMGDSLRRLLPQLLDQGYDRIFVLDDASNDDSAEAVGEFGDKVTFVASPVNRGAGANRNQILEHVDDATLIHFVDADMDLLTRGTAAVARDLAARYAGRGVGVIGGLVCRVDGSQEPHNFGPLFSLRRGWASGLPLLLDALRGMPRLAGALRRVTAAPLRYWPDVLGEPRPASVGFVHEGNMLVHAGALRTVGGYEVTLREHEAQELSLRLEGHRIKRQFDPAIKVIHHYVDVRGRGRFRKQLDAVVFIIRRHGFLGFLIRT